MDVVIKKEQIREIISKWLGVDVFYVDECLCGIFSKLGFNILDEIVIYDVDKENTLLFRVNDQSFCRINLKSNCDEKYPIMYFIDDRSHEYGYQCIVNNDVDVKLNLFRYNSFLNDRNVFYEVSNEWIEYSVYKDGNLLELRVSKPNNYVTNSGYYSMYKLPNYKKLRKYFSNLDFSLSILDIYKGICEISLGDDTSKYSYVDLRKIKCNENELDDDFKITDMIQLQDGQLFTVIITRNGRQVYLNNEGRCLCDTKRAQVEFSTFRTSIINFNSRVMPKCNIGDYTDELAYEDMNSARVEVVKVRKLVNEMFPNRNGMMNRW